MMQARPLRLGRTCSLRAARPRLRLCSDPWSTCALPQRRVASGRSGGSSTDSATTSRCSSSDSSGSDSSGSGSGSGSTSGGSGGNADSDSGDSSLRGLVLTQQAKTQLGVVLVSSALLQLGIGMIVPILPAYASSVGLTEAHVGVVIAVPAMARACLNLPAGHRWRTCWGASP